MKSVKCSLAIAIIGLVGCVDKTIQPQVENQLAFQKDRMAKIQIENGEFERHAVPFVSSKTFVEPEPKPKFLSKQVYLHAQTPLGLKYYANKIASQIGKPVRVGQDIYTVDRIITQELQGTNTSSNDASTIIDKLVTKNQEKQSPLAMRDTLKLEGSAENALNTIASTFNVHWKYDNNQVVIYKLETKRLRLNLLLKEQMTANFQGSTTSGNAEGGLTSQITSTFEGASFESYEEAIDSMLSPYGEAHVLGNSGAIVVTDTPEKLQAVQDFLDFENKSLTQQIALDVEVVRITSSDGNDVGIVWDELLADFGDLSFGLVSSTPKLSKTNVTNLTGTINAGRLSGSKLILKALASKARVSVLTRETRKVLNNSPAEFRDISVIEYPSESTQSTDNGVTTITTTKGTIRPGFDMTVVPRITDDNKVILSVVTTMSRNLPFDEISVGGSTQKFANLVQKELKTVEVISDGQTSMLTGYINNSLSTQSEGTGNADMWALGGGQSNSKGKDMLIIFVTPHIFRG